MAELTEALESARRELAQTRARTERESTERDELIVRLRADLDEQHSASLLLNQQVCVCVYLCVFLCVCMFVCVCLCVCECLARLSLALHSLFVAECREGDKAVASRRCGDFGELKTRCRAP